MKRVVAFTGFLILLCTNLPAQEGKTYIKGKVESETYSGKTDLITGANVYWMSTTVGTVTDTEGKFTMERLDTSHLLVVSFIGYKGDTIDVSGKETVTVQLKKSVELPGVDIVQRLKSTEISFLNPLKVESIGEKELLKAACCNLSESFETSPSIDVAFTDAVTGTRQIQMLGLAGPYTQITRENIPDVRGLASIYGLTFIPGTWIESIQLNKGAGSVVNGYESIAGQINVELRKPESSDRMYLNAYANEGGRLEANANLSHKFSDKWSTAMLLHGKNSSVKNDRNHDGFLDNPLDKQIIVMNRWKYIGQKGTRFQAGIKSVYLDNLGGQTIFNPLTDAGTTKTWGMHMSVKRLEWWTKTGKVFKDKPWGSAGLQISGARHVEKSYFGMNNYNGEQNTFYSNFIYQSIIKTTDHQIRTGVSFQYDNYFENLNDTVYKRTEAVPGAYFEYIYTKTDRFSAVVGIRTDYHNTFGPFFTPRLHIRYAVTENTVMRGSAGRGQRTANIFAENYGLLATSRQIVVKGENNNKPYGLKPEIAWNYGINITKSFKLDYRDGSVSFDFYRTDFENQIVVDLDQSPQQVVLYNLNGKSYSNSFQTQLDYEVLKRFDTRLAYRWYNVQTTYGNNLMDKPLVAEHRAFINLAYESRKNWKFDYTLNWQGQKRIPFTGTNPEEFSMPERSPDFFLMNAQVSKLWKEKFEMYAGIENLMNFIQKDPILSAANPFSPYFDSSLIWGPIFGRMIYLGARYRIK